MHTGSDNLVGLYNLIEANRLAAREFVRQGMTTSDVARAFRLSECAVRDLLSDAPAVSMATTQEILQRKPRNA